MTHAPAAQYIHLSASGTNSGTIGANTGLVAVNVNTGAASAVLTISDGGASGPVVATIDASAKGTYLFGNVRLHNGLYAALAGGSADVTISYI